MAFIRSVVHALFCTLTLVVIAIAVLLASIFIRGVPLYWLATYWMKSVVHGLRVICGVHWRISGYDNLPVGSNSPAILLLKHTSTYETLLMTAIMPHPLAYVFKKELLYIPFFGWAMGRLDMIHIDRSARAEAFNKVVKQGQVLLDQGIWIIMFPEGTRIPRGQKGTYKTGGTRLAVQTGAPVIPIAVTSAKCWPRKGFIKRPGVVDVSIGKPIPSTGRDPDELMAEVEAFIESEMRRLDPEGYATAAPKPAPQAARPTP